MSYGKIETTITTPSARPISIKRAKLTICVEEIPFTKSHVPLIMWGRDVMGQNKSFISPFPRDL